MKIVYANPAFANITGYSVEEILSFPPKKVTNLVHSDDKELVWGNFKKKFAGQSVPDSYHFKAVSKGGDIKILELHAQLIEFENRPAIQGIVLDITERIEAQKALKESEEKFRSIFENSGIGKAIFTPDGKFIRVNSSFAGMFGYKINEFSTKHLIDIIHPSETGLTSKIIKEFAQDKTFNYRKFENQYLRKDGEAFWGFVIITPLHNENGELTFLIAQLLDVTKRKNAETKLINYAEELEDLNKSKDRLFSIISHDLRSPFNALLGLSDYTTKFIDILSKEEIKDSVERINSSAKKVFNLMNNLFEWTQIKRDGLNIEKTKIDLLRISNDVLELYYETAINKNINLINNISDSMFLLADSHVIETILRNLVSNGIKFTYPGGIVSINAYISTDFAEVTVQDTGIGISSENQQKLFTINEQYRSDGTADEKGTGLGLILCKELVEKINGKFSVESKLNKGTKFTFTVPLYKN